MKGMPGGMQQFLKQANQMQQRMQKLQGELAGKQYDASSGGGAVTVVVSGESKIVSLKISDDVIKSGDAEMLQDLILTAVNEAIKKSKDSYETEMNKITGGLAIPGMF